MENLIIDLNMLNEAYNYAKISCDEFEEIFSNLNKCMDILRDDKWKSNASEAFFEMYDSVLRNDIKVFLGVVERMKFELENIQIIYKEMNELEGFPKGFQK